MEKALQGQEPLRKRLQKIGKLRKRRVERALRRQEQLMKVLQSKWLVEKALQRQEPLRKRLQRVGKVHWRFQKVERALRSKGLLKKGLRKRRAERA